MERGFIIYCLNLFFNPKIFLQNTGIHSYVLGINGISEQRRQVCRGGDNYGEDILFMLIIVKKFAL